MLNPSLISRELDPIITKFSIWDYSVLLSLLYAIYICTINIQGNKKFTNIFIGMFLLNGYFMDVPSNYKSIVIFLESIFWLKEIYNIWRDIQFDAEQLQYVFFGTTTMLGASAIYEFICIIRKIIM